MANKPDSVEEVLAKLEQNGNIKLAPSTASGACLSGDNKIAVLDGLNNLQRRFVRKKGTDRGRFLSEATIIHYNMLLQSPNKPEAVGYPIPILVEVDISQVPTMLAHPIRVKRKIEPFIKVSIRCCSWARICLPISVTAYAIDEAAVASMEEWVPTANSGLQCNRATGTGTTEPFPHLKDRLRELNLPLPPWVSEDKAIAHCGNWEFTFKNMFFDRPSQMRPRWLVFEANIEHSDSALYTLFMIPTIVMCRATDQAGKATKFLWGAKEGGRIDLPLRELPTSTTAAGILSFVLADLQKSLGFRRPFTMQCAHTLATRGGIVFGRGSVSVEQVAKEVLLNPYINGTKLLLQTIKTHFDTVEPSPTVICDLSVGREDAELLLNGHPPRTFILRLGSQPGTLVQSTVTSLVEPNRIEHRLITLEEVQHKTLDSVVNFHKKSHMLLDMHKGKHYPKCTLFKKDYVDEEEIKEIMEYTGRYLSDYPPSSPSCEEGAARAGAVLGKRKVMTEPLNIINSSRGFIPGAAPLVMQQLGHTMQNSLPMMNPLLQQYSPMQLVPYSFMQQQSVAMQPMMLPLPQGHPGQDTSTNAVGIPFYSQQMAYDPRCSGATAGVQLQPRLGDAGIAADGQARPGQGSHLPNLVSRSQTIPQDQQHQQLPENGLDLSFLADDCDLTVAALSRDPVIDNLILMMGPDILDVDMLSRPISPAFSE